MDTSLIALCHWNTAAAQEGVCAAAVPDWSAHRCCDHYSQSLGVQLGYCEGLQCGHLWIVPIMPTPLLPSASTSNVSASFPHVAHGVVWMEPGDISAWSVSSIVTIAYVGLLSHQIDHALFGLASV